MKKHCTFMARKNVSLTETFAEESRGSFDPRVWRVEAYPLPQSSTIALYHYTTGQAGQKKYEKVKNF